MFFNRRKGGGLLILATIVVFVIIVILGLDFFRIIPGLLKEGGCDALCGSNFERAKKSGCWCGTEMTFGKYLHLSVSLSGDETLHAFHLTDLPIPEISDYDNKVADFTDNCDDNNDVSLTDWENRNEDYEGCLVYVVDKSGGDDGCSLYGVEEGKKLEMESGKSLSEILDSAEKLEGTNEEENVWSGFEFGSEIELKNREKAGQKHLLKNPYGNTDGSTTFNLNKKVNCTKKGDRYIWEI